LGVYVGWVSNMLCLKFRAEMGLHSQSEGHAKHASLSNFVGKCSPPSHTTRVLFMSLQAFNGRSFFHIVFIILPYSGSSLNQCSLLRKIVVLLEIENRRLDFYFHMAPTNGSLQQR